MALCNITIQDVVNWARTFTKLIPIAGVGGFTNEPALSIANDTLQTMLSRPYAWKFNRKAATPFDTVENQQDYSQAITDLGWLEDCSIEMKASTATIKPTYDIEVKKSLSPSHFVHTPGKIAVETYNDTTVTFRLDPVPGSTIWTVKPIYQIAAPLKTQLTDKWTPFPDTLAFVYRQGFLAHAFKHVGDPRAAAEFAVFIAMLRSAAGVQDAEPDDIGFFPDRPIMIG